MDLCDSSEGETSGPDAKPRLRRSNPDIVVIGDSSDEEMTPKKQDVIEICSSSDDEPPQVKASVAELPPPGADFDSSDDELDLHLFRQRMALRRSTVPSQPTSGSETSDKTIPAAVLSVADGSKSEERSNGLTGATSYGKQPHSAIREHSHDGSHAREAQHANAGRATLQLRNPVSRDISRDIVQRDETIAQLNSGTAISPVKTRTSSNGDKRQVFASFAGNTAKRLMVKNYGRNPPFPSERDMVPLGTKANRVSRLQYRTRKLATARLSYSENSGQHESFWKRALKRPKFSNGKMEIGPQSSGRGLDAVATRSRKMPPAVTESRQTDLTSYPTAFDEGITNDENNFDSIPGLSLSSQLLRAESETPSSSRAMSSQSKDWSSVNVPCGSDGPPDKGCDENNVCHLSITNTQGGGSFPPSADSAASYEMIAEEAHASPASLRGDFSKRVSSSAESDASDYERSSPNCSDFVASSDYNSDNMSGELVAEESESRIADLDCQLDAMDIQPVKRSSRKKINVEKSTWVKMTESQECIPPLRKQDLAKTSEERSIEEEPTVSRRSTRKKKPVELYFPPMQDSFGQEEEEEEEGVFLHIDHLSRYKYNKLGRPTYYLSVMGPDGKTICVCEMSRVADVNLTMHFR